MAEIIIINDLNKVDFIEERMADDMIVEILEVSGELLIKFNLKTEGDSTKRRIPDEELEDYIRNNMIQSIEDMGITVNDTRMYNFDTYKSRKEVLE